jgi:parallel beta-helix repeat protein
VNYNTQSAKVIVKKPMRRQRIDKYLSILLAVITLISLPAFINPSNPIENHVYEPQIMPIPSDLPRIYQLQVSSYSVLDDLDDEIFDSTTNTLHDVIIDGQMTAEYGIWLEKIAFPLKMERVYIINFPVNNEKAKNIRIDECTSSFIEIKDCMVFDAATGVFSNQTNNIKITNLTAVYPGQTGIYFYGGNNITISQSTIHSSAYWGIYLSQTTNVILNENIVRHSGWRGVYANTGSNFNFVSNQILNSSEEGFLIIQATNVNITNSIITDSGFRAISLSGLSNVKVISNQIQNSGQEGIISNSSNSVTIFNNNVSDCLGNGISVIEGVGNIVNENLVSNSKMGIFTSGGGPNPGIRIHDNVLRNNQLGGIFAGAAPFASVIGNDVQNTAENGIMVVNNQNRVKQEIYYNRFNVTLVGGKYHLPITNPENYAILSNTAKLEFVNQLHYTEQKQQSIKSEIFTQNSYTYRQGQSIYTHNIPQTKYNQIFVSNGDPVQVFTVDHPEIHTVEYLQNETSFTYLRVSANPLAGQYAVNFKTGEITVNTTGEAAGVIFNVSYYTDYQAFVLPNPCHSIISIYDGMTLYQNVESNPESGFFTFDRTENTVYINATDGGLGNLVFQINYYSDLLSFNVPVVPIHSMQNVNDGISYYNFVVSNPQSGEYTINYITGAVEINATDSNPGGLTFTVSYYLDRNQYTLASVPVYQMIQVTDELGSYTQVASNPASGQYTINKTSGLLYINTSDNPTGNRHFTVQYYEDISVIYLSNFPVETVFSIYDNLGNNYTMEENGLSSGEYRIDKNTGILHIDCIEGLGTPIIFTISFTVPTKTVYQLNRISDNTSPDPGNFSFYGTYFMTDDTPWPGLTFESFYDVSLPQFLQNYTKIVGDYMILSFQYDYAATVKDNIANGNGGTGILISYNNKTTIEDNKCQNNGFAGMIVSSGSDSYILNNSLEYNGEYGLIVENEKNLLIGGSANDQNYIQLNNGIGVKLQNCMGNVTFSTNTVSENGGTGMLVNSSNIVIINSLIKSNQQEGIWLTRGENLIQSTEISYNQKTGVIIDGENNIIEANSNVSYNSENGIIILSSSNKISLTSVNNNLKSGIILGAQDNIINYTQIKNNGEFGIQIDGSNQQCVHNVMTGSGIYLIPGVKANLQSHTIQNTTLNNNPIIYTTSGSQLINTSIGQIIAVGNLNLRIENITIDSASIAIGLYYTDGARISNVLMQNNYYRAIFAYQISGLNISDSIIYNSQTAIEIIGSDNLVRNTNIFNSIECGIDAKGTKTIIYNSTIQNSSKDGVRFEGYNHLVLSSHISEIGRYGIIANGQNQSVITTTIDMNSGIYGILFGNHTQGAINQSQITLTSGIGIYIFNSTKTILEKNTITTNQNISVVLDTSLEISLQNNNMFGYGLSFEGSQIEYYQSHFIPIGNNRNGIPIRYYIYYNGGDLSSYCSQAILVNCNNTRLTGLDINGAGIGLQIYFSNRNTFSGKINNSLYYGIKEWQGSKNIFNDMQIINSGLYGYFATETSENEFTNCDFQNNYRIGIKLTNSDNIQISRCKLSLSERGIETNNVNNLLIRNCNFTENSYAIEVSGGVNNIIEQNVFSFTTWHVIQVQNNNYMIIRNNTINNARDIIKLINSPNTRIERVYASNLVGLIGIEIDQDCQKLIIDRLHLNYTTFNNESIGIDCRSNEAYITNVLLNNSGIGINMNGVADVTIIFSQIVNGSIGIKLQTCSKILISDNQIYSMQNSGIDLQDCSNISIQNSIFNYNYYAYRLFNSHSIVIRFNSFCGNWQIKSAELSTYDDRFNSLCSELNTSTTNDEINIDTDDPNQSGYNDPIGSVPGFPVLVLILSISIGIGIIIRKFRLYKH